MPIEIERKFLLTIAPDRETLGPGQTLRQSYLAEENDVTVRVRIVEHVATLTVKAGAGLVRTEVEVPISSEEAEALWVHTAGRRIDKVRHRVPLGTTGQLIAEVDIYAGDLTGLCTVEVEFASAAAATSFVPPDWFGREVTDSPSWTNSSLARHGLPDRP